jgi:hypothetical protein
MVVLVVLAAAVACSDSKPRTRAQFSLPVGMIPLRTMSPLARCDVRVRVADITIDSPPDGGGPQRLPRVCGAVLALESIAIEGRVFRGDPA